MSKIRVTTTIEVTTSFEEYETLEQNKKAIKAIERWFKDALVDSIGHVPLYIEKEESWPYSSIEDCTGAVRAKVISSYIK